MREKCAEYRSMILQRLSLKKEFFFVIFSCHFKLWDEGERESNLANERNAIRKKSNKKVRKKCKID